MFYDMRSKACVHSSFLEHHKTCIQENINMQMHTQMVGPARETKQLMLYANLEYTKFIMGFIVNERMGDYKRPRVDVLNYN